jgi:hypothetical protein
MKEPKLTEVTVDPDSVPCQRLSAKATRKHGAPLTEAEIDVAEEEALAWARRANSC